MKNLIIVVKENIPESILKGISEEGDTYIEYDFPEIKKHPKEQLEWINEVINYILDYPGIVFIKTYSDFIIREINILIMRKTIDYKLVKILDRDCEVMKDSEDDGIGSDSLDNVIDEQNSRTENIYYDLRYGSEEMEEEE